MYAVYHLAYRSVVDLTSSRFQRPQVNCRAVEANNSRFMPSSMPMGPKKYANISESPANRMKQKDDRIELL